MTVQHTGPDLTPIKNTKAGCVLHDYNTFRTFTIQPYYYNKSSVITVGRSLRTSVLRKFSNVSKRLDFGVKSTCLKSVIQNCSRSKLRWKIFSVSADMSGPSLEWKITVIHTVCFKALCFRA